MQFKFQFEFQFGFGFSFGIGPVFSFSFSFRMENGMQVGDRVRANEHSHRAGVEGVIERPCILPGIKDGEAWYVKTDEGHIIDVFEYQLDIISPAPVESKSIKGDVLELAQRNRTALLDAIAEFRQRAERGETTVISELSLFVELLDNLIKD